MAANLTGTTRTGFSPEGWFAPAGSQSTPERVSAAAGHFLHWLRGEGHSSLLIGYDHSREWKPWIEAIASAGQALGLSCAVGERPCPLPALAHACREVQAPGMYFSASLTNPEAAMGFRWLSPDGEQVPLPQAEQIAAQEVETPPSSTMHSPELRDFTAPYHSWLTGLIDPRVLRRARLRLLVDASGGTTNRILESVLGGAVERINTIYGLPMRHFFHRIPSPCSSEVKELAGQVARGKWNGGILLAGDGSRLALVNSDGDWIPLAHAAAKAGMRVQWRLAVGEEARVPGCSHDVPAAEQGTAQEVIIGPGNRVQIEGVTPGWDAVASVLVLIRSRPDLFAPDDQMPVESLFLLSPGQNAVLSEEHWRTIAQTDWQGERPLLRVVHFLNQPVAVVASWERMHCWAALAVEEGGHAMAVHFVAPGTELLESLKDHVGRTFAFTFPER